jgi:hypothetical protein
LKPKTVLITKQPQGLPPAKHEGLTSKLYNQMNQSVHMARMGKQLTVCLVVSLVLFSQLFAVPVYAQSIPKPSVPAFTISYVDLSYDVPASTSTFVDPYTGDKTITTHEGYRVNSQKITLTVKNQPFNAHIGNNTYHLCYDVITKGHFEEGNWEDTVLRREQSEGEYTTISFKSSYPPNSQIDIRIIAEIFHDGQQIVWGAAMATHEIINGYVFDISSDWSQIQTLNLADGSSKVSDVATPTPTVPEFPFAIILSLFGLIFFMTVLVKKKSCLKAYN